MPSMQSAYRKHLSTEIALLQVINDVLRTEYCRQELVLLLLDLSAAFDTLDHTILLDRLSRYFGFSHTVLRWFSSYLTGRIQSVTITQHLAVRRLECGIPQGSILGPLLFILNTAPIQDIISAHNLDCMFYADDSQLYNHQTEFVILVSTKRELILSHHINKKKKAMLAIRFIGRLRKYLSKDQLNMVVNALLRHACIIIIIIIIIIIAACKKN